MKLPKAWTDDNKYVRPSPVTACKSQVKAKIDMSEEVVGRGLCPECKQPMKPCIVNGFPALFCLEDRIVLPAKK